MLNTFLCRLAASTIFLYNSVVRALRHKPQIILFSATFPPHVWKFAELLVPPPYFKLRMERKKLTVEGIKQVYINCGRPENRINVLSKIMDNVKMNGQLIIFVQTRHGADELAHMLRSSSWKPSVIYGGNEMSPAARDKTLKEFVEGRSKVLIATNVLARGIDIKSVMMVLNYDLPLDKSNKPDYETYLHRIGRSGRFGRKGLAVSFVYDEKTKRQILDIGAYYQKEIEEIKNTDEDIFRLNKIMKTIELVKVKEDED